MPEQIAYLEAVVGADITSFRRAMAQVRGDITGVHTGLSQSLRNIGRDMTYALTVPLLAVGAGAIKIASDYDKVIHNIASISEDFYQDMERQSDAILRFGASTMSGPKAAAEAYYQVVSAGVTNAADAMAIMEASVATAEAGLANLEATTTGMTQAMLAFGAFTDPAFRNVSDAAQHFSNVLTRTVQLGVGSMDDFVISMGRAVSATAAAGGSYDDLGIAVSFFTQRGMTAYNAATSMTNIMNKLITPTAELTTVFRQLGVTTGQELFEKFGDMGGVMRALYSVVGDNTQRWAEMFNTIQAKRGIFTITNDMQSFLDYVDEFNRGLDTATQTARDIQLMSFEAQVRLLNSSISALAVSIGQALIPVLVPVIQKITDFFLKASQLNPAIIELIVAVGAFVAALGPLVWIIGTLLSPMGLLIGLVAGVGVAFATNFNGIATAISSAVNTAIPSLSNLTSTISSFFDMLTGQGQYGMTSWNVLGNEDGTLPAALQQIKQFSVAPGDTLWGLQGTTGLSVEQMMQAAGITDPRALQPGNYTYTGSGSGSTGSEGYNPQLLHPPTGNLSNRFAAAWAVFGQSIIDGIKSAFAEVTNWISTEGATEIGRLLGRLAAELYRAVAVLFLSDKSGGEGGGAGGFASTFAANLSSGIQQGIEDAGFEPGSFNGFVSNVIAAIGVAFLSWKFVGMLPFVGGFAQSLIGGIISSLAGGAIAGTVAKAGLGASLGGAIGSLLSTVIQGGIGVIKLLPLSVGLLLNGVYGAFVDILSVGPGFWLKYTFGAAGSVLASVGSGFVSLIAGIIASPVVMGAIIGTAIYELIPQETRDSIGQAVLNVFATIFGKEPININEWRTGVFADVAGWLASVFELFGNEEEAARWWQIAYDAAASIGDDIMEGFKRGLMAEFEDTDPLTTDDILPHVLDFSYLTGAATGTGMINELNQNQLEFGLGGSQDFSDMEGIGGKRSRPKKASGLSQGIFAPLISGMKAEVQTGMTEVNDTFTSGFTDIGTQIDTSTLDVGAKLLAFSAGVLAAVPSVLIAFGALAISVGIGMNALLLVVTTYANLIIAKWNEMLMTLGAAPTMMGYSPDAYAGAGGAVTNTTNVYVTTDKPARLNDSLRKAGTSVLDGSAGVIKGYR